MTDPSSASLRRPPRLWAAVAALLITLLALLLPIRLPGTFIWAATQSLSHTVLFTLLGLLSLRTGLLGHLQTWFLLATFGALTELLQHYTGRQASLGDLYHDLIGISLAVVLHSLSVHRRPFLTLAATALCLTALAPFLWSLAAYANRAQQFPVLFRFTTPLDTYFLERSGTRHRTVWPARCANVIDHALLVPVGTDPFAGVLLHEPVRNWRGMQNLTLRFTLQGSQDVRLTVRVHDERHDWSYDDRFNREYQISRGVTQSIVIPVAELEHGPTNGRLLDLDRIAGVALFRATGGPATRLCLTSLELQPRRP